MLNSLALESGCLPRCKPTTKMKYSASKGTVWPRFQQSPFQWFLLPTIFRLLKLPLLRTSSSKYNLHGQAEGPFWAHHNPLFWHWDSWPWSKADFPTSLHSPSQTHTPPNHPPSSVWRCPTVLVSFDSTTAESSQDPTWNYSESPQ